ncbi:hypothetical protein GGR50DRAFT_699024 [Xylaria sp. CBS 124048]|nr:hypothetical protein GGR50DRAFT_699024 [Xylaria sp. CBS 124048]
MPCTINHAALLQRKPPVVLCPECILPLRARSPGIVDLPELPSSPVHSQNQASSAPLLDNKPIAFSPRSKHTPPGLITPMLNSTHHVLPKKPQDVVNYITIHVYAAEEYPEKISELDYVRLEGLQKIATMHQNAVSLATKFSGQGEPLTLADIKRIVSEAHKDKFTLNVYYPQPPGDRLAGADDSVLIPTRKRQRKLTATNLHEGARGRRKTNVKVEIKPEIKPEVKPEVKPNVNGIDKAGEEAGLQHKDETADSSTQKSRYNNLGPPLQTRGAAKKSVSGHKRTYLEANQGEGEDVASSGSDRDPLEDAEQLDLTGFAE